MLTIVISRVFVRSFEMLPFEPTKAVQGGEVSEGRLQKFHWGSSATRGEGVFQIT